MSAHRRARISKKALILGPDTVNLSCSVGGGFKARDYEITAIEGTH
jgi:hypothetical protein